MNSAEKIAKYYLEQQGLGPLIFEPDGKISPDFTISKRIAIEVRRLNRILIGKSITSNEENIYIPFEQMLKEVLSTFDTQYNGKTYWVGINYNAPFLPSNSIKKQLRNGLAIFLNLHDVELPYTLILENNDVSLLIFNLKMPSTGHTFKSIGTLNYGIPSITKMYIENIQWCIIEKSNKIEPNKYKYPEWQLLLVDFMRWELDIGRINIIKTSITDLGLFDSLIVISYEGKLLFIK